MGQMIHVLKCILKKQDMKVWTTEFNKHGNEPSTSLKGGGILDHLRHY